MPTERPWLLLYDADCGLCRTLLAGLLRWDRRGRLRPLALQEPGADELLADLAPAERLASWHLVSPAVTSGPREETTSPAGRWSGGAALPPLLRLLPAGRAPAAVFARFPRLGDRGYRWVAEHRSRLSRIVPVRLKRRADRLLATREAPRGSSN